MKRIAGILLPLFLFALSTNAQTAEFTFQGRLTVSGNPAAAPHDFEFRLYNAESNGTQLGPTLFRSNVSVSDGVFTVRLDFGPEFPGAGRWLDISVRPVGGSSFTPLSPRQPITSAPYNIRSISSGTADVAANSFQLGGVAASQYVVTTDPRMTDSRPPTPDSSNYIQNTTPGAGVNFNIAGNGTASGTLTAGGLTVDTNTLHVDAPGNKVGVGTTAPAAVLHVAGSQPPPGGAIGTDAGEVLRVVGGAGGNGTNFGGTGGGVLIQGGVGGLDGRGGSITLQPGMGGVQGASGTINAGNLLLAPNAGSVGVGINPALMDSFTRALYIGNDSGNVNNHFRLDGFGNNLYVVAQSPAPSAAGAGIIFKTGTAGTGESERMAITPAGHIGIGTPSPVDKLQLISGTADIRIGSTNGDGMEIRSSAIGLAPVLTLSNTGANGRRYRIASSRDATTGNFAIRDDTGGFDVLRTDQFGKTIFPSGSVIVPSHRVGIGTTDPLATLHVEGNEVLSTGFQSGFRFRDRGSTSEADDWIWYSNTNIARLFRNGPGDLLTVSATGVVQLFGLGTAGGVFLCRNASNQIAACSSSIRYKQNVNSFASGLELVNRLRPVTFNWKADNKPDMGLVAEEVAEVAPLLATYNKNGEIEGVKYDRIGVVLINAVKEQQAQIELQQKQIDALKKLVCELKPDAAVCKEK